MKATGIEWTTFSTNPLKYRDSFGNVVWACVKCSSGCTNCYAEATAFLYNRGKPFTKASMAELTPFVDPKELHKILTAKTVDKIPTAGGMVFLGDMTDIFGEWVPFELIDQIFAVMALRSDMTFQVLTKRPERMAEYLGSHDVGLRWWRLMPVDLRPVIVEVANAWTNNGLPNVWLGTSVENQKAADFRIPHLLKCPASVRFLSCEPLLGPVDLFESTLKHYQQGYPADRVDWVIVGGESGHNSRETDIENIRKLVIQCQSTKTPIFVKQLGSNPVETQATGGIIPLKLAGMKGNETAEWPADLRVREFPKAGAV